MNRKLHALLATSRIANVPSVICNTWLGVATGWLFTQTDGEVPLLNEFGKLALAGTALYIGGNFLNDWWDRDWDKTHRPERALPQHWFSTNLYLGTAISLMILGIAAAAWCSLASSLVAAIITLAIVIYTTIHKKTAWGVVFMGLCRALLPVMGCMAFFPYMDRIWPAALALFCYIAGLSLTARHESKADPGMFSAVASRSLLLTAAVAMVWFAKSFSLPRIPVLVGVTPYLLWTAYSLRRRPVPKLVASLLAGIPWVDAAALLPIGFALTGGHTTDFAIGCLSLPPLSFLAALFLQRVAPAT